MKYIKHCALTMLLSVCLGSTLAAERPSVSKNAQKIAALEVRTEALEQDATSTKTLVTENKTLIEQNKQAISDIAVIEGPRGPAGPQGPRGEDGALADLRCQPGQMAQFDGIAWQCASGAEITPNDRHQACIQGFDFSLQGLGPLLTGLSINGIWREACGLLGNHISLRGPIVPGTAERTGQTTTLLTQEIRAPQVDLPQSRNFTDGLIGIYSHAITNLDVLGEGITAEISFTLVSLNSEIDEDLVNWSSDAVLEYSTFTLQQDDMGLRLSFNRCRPDAFSAVPEFQPGPRGDVELRVKQTLTITCIPMDMPGSANNTATEVQHYDRFWQQLLDIYLQSGFNRENTSRIDVSFDTSAGDAITEFDRSLPQAVVSQIQLPAFFQDPNRLFGREISPWVAGPHGIELKTSTLGTDLPQ